MRGTKLLAALVLSLAAWLASGLVVEAHGSGVAIGVRFGGPVYYPRPYYAPYYYRPAVVVAPPLYVQPSPVYVQPSPVYVQPAPVVVQPAPAPLPAPPPAQAAPVRTAYKPVANVSDDELQRQWQLLSHAEDKVRADAALQLGRLRSERAIEALAAVLAQDRSPQVRDSAARALGLIGTARALPPLRDAALSDADRDVRRSAQVSMEVITSQLKGGN